jgi:hypothetical protein
LSLQQLRREISELRKVIILDEPAQQIPLTPETLRCSEEVKTAQKRARQRLKDNGVSDAELKRYEQDGFICDTEVVQAHHNFLKAAWNAKNPDKPQIKINYLFDCPVEVENYKRAYDKLNEFSGMERTSEVIEAEYELLRDVTKAGV